MQKGNIRVQTENIFPIIKKFLYSDHDIFIRELVSNAVDATQKLKTLSSLGEAKGEIGELSIDIQLDKEKKTITISDQGVGMTGEEVDKYLNQVAFSGAEEFLSKYKGQNETNIIGHFGLGFYSSFMVSEKVEVFTKSYLEDAPAVRWECDGSPEFTLEQTEKAARGTDVVLHINEESEEFLDAERIRTILKKFCRFLPVPIRFEGQQINNPTPAWTKRPSELTSQDYQDFYKELYPFSEAPLFWIHLNVDYPFHLTGILYFPKIKQSYEIQKDKIQLYSNQVFVTDEVKDIVPEFLMLLHGVIDSPDIPLNVSRSYLQGDPNVRKINNHITKKVADKLEEIFTRERKEFEEKWESLGLFVKYGMMTDDKFLEKAVKFHIMEDVKESKFYTLDEYRTATEALQKNKDGKLVILYTSNPVQQDSYIRQAQSKGYIVVKLETIVDAAFINQMEMKWPDVHFTRVDSDIVDNLIDKAETSGSVLNAEEEGLLKELFSRQVPELHVTVDVKGMSPEAPPVIATRPEFMRRMKDMAAVGGGGMGGFYANMPDEVNLTVNGNHPIFQSILKEEDRPKQEKLVHNLSDLALLSQGLLKGNNLTDFIQRSVELMSGEPKGRIILEA
ncbi:MAG TPA: molecular chaperone HtpG [Puia sp.]|jgi:molecular chaperone HtpG|nr:molecular chaperone HtpG [Puia sp.]